MIQHVGMAALDFRSPAQVAREDLEAALDKRLGKVIPAIEQLEHTTKDWIFEHGLHRPPPPPILFNPTHYYGLLTTSTPSFLVGPGAPPIHISGVQFANPYAGYVPPTPPEPLPAEKRDMPVIGYRSWKFKPVYSLGWGHRGHLLPQNEGYGAWKKGVNRASCKNGGSHRAGDQFCTCGYYVVADLDSAERWTGGMTDDTVVGAVMGWGQVVQHGKEGWRAEYAKIIALLDCKFSAKQEENTKAAANSYGLEIYSRPALEAYVKEWGDPFAESVTTPAVMP